MNRAILFVIGIAIVGGIIFAVSQKEPQVDSSRSTNETTQGADSEKFQIPAGTIGYFFSEYCHWCQQEKPILEELEKEGYRFTRVDVTKEREMTEYYQITGTPTFVTPKGEKHSGYLDKEQLKSWIESNK